VKRIIVLLTVAALMMVMLAMSVAPAFGKVTQLPCSEGQHGHQVIPAQQAADGVKGGSLRLTASALSLAGSITGGAGCSNDCNPL
jgi:hypothetical protein